MKPSFTRRGFVASAIAFPYALRSFAQSAESTRWVFLGTDKGSGIYRCSWNSATGKLGLPELAARCERPAFFALHPKLPLLYAVNSVAGPGAGLTAFRLAPNSGTLSAVSRQTSKGDGPCYVSVDATGRSAFVANYSGGSFTAYGLTVDGLLLPPTGTLSCHQAPACGNPGPVTDRQDASHLHCAVTSPGNDFVLACDLGNDAIEVLAIKPGEDNPLGSAKRFTARPGSGPRHLAFHPNRRWVYVIHELDCTLELFDWSVAGGRSSLVRRDGTAISTLAAGAALAGNSAL